MSRKYLISRDDASNLAGEDLFWAVVEPMWEDLNFYEDPRTAADFFEMASPVQGAMIAMWWCRSEVCNGGFDQFFWNSTGMIWPCALQGFRLVGANSYAELLEKALSVFPGGVAPIERNERDKILESNEERMNTLEPTDQAFFALEREKTENLNALCAKYIRSNPNEFFKD
jgi:hypothetical protein